MSYIWLKYRFERVSENGDGAYFTKLPDLLLFNIPRTAHQPGGIEVFQSDSHCRETLKESHAEKSKTPVLEYTGQQMEKALEAIRQYRNRRGRS